MDGGVVNAVTVNNEADSIAAVKRKGTARQGTGWSADAKFTLAHMVDLLVWELDLDPSLPKVPDIQNIPVGHRLMKRICTVEIHKY